MKSLNKTETPIFLSVVCSLFPNAIFLTFIKALLQLANFTLGPDATLNTEIYKNSARIKAPNSVNASKLKHKKIKLITIINKDEYSWLTLLYVAEPNPRVKALRRGLH